MSFTTSIVVSFQWWATHRWPDAKFPHDYLANEHRHLFTGTAEIVVTHDDRELEFFNVLDYIEMQLVEWTKLGTKSCEQVATDLIHRLKHNYGEREMTVAIYEDGFNGAVVDYVPGARP